MTFLGSGSSPAFLARSLSAAAKVDMEEAGGEQRSPGNGNGGMRGFFRKATREDGMHEVLERVNFKQKFSSLPQFNPGVSPSSMPSLPASPQVSECIKEN